MNDLLNWTGLNLPMIFHAIIGNTDNVKPQYQVIFTSTGVSLIIRTSVSHRVTLPYFILNADLESLKHRL